MFLVINTDHIFFMWPLAHKPKLHRPLSSFLSPLVNTSVTAMLLHAVTRLHLPTFRGPQSLSDRFNTRIHLESVRRAACGTKCLSLRPSVAGLREVLARIIYFGIWSQGKRMGMGKSKAGKEVDPVQGHLTGEGIGALFCWDFLQQHAESATRVDVVGIFLLALIP